jgi:hypothetical protein
VRDWSVTATNLAHGGESTPTDRRIGEVYSWASQLASESRTIDWIIGWYLWPDAVRLILRRLDAMKGGVIGLVGPQGVGKSSALLATLIANIILQNEHRRMKRQKNNSEATNEESDIILFKWRRQAELFPSLFDGTHEASASFCREYGKRLLAQLERSFPLMDFKEVRSNPGSLNFQWAEGRLGRAGAKQWRQVAWLEMLRRKRIILIDTPDYSKTDRRLMAKDLEEIYWLWNYLSKSSSLDDDVKLNLVVATRRRCSAAISSSTRCKRSNSPLSGPNRCLKRT